LLCGQGSAARFVKELGPILEIISHLRTAEAKHKKLGLVASSLLVAGLVYLAAWERLMSFS
jgi:hypothetical protein